MTAKRPAIETTELAPEETKIMAPDTAPTVGPDAPAAIAAPSTPDDGLVAVTLAHHWAERVRGEDGKVTIVDHLPGDELRVHQAVAADLAQSGYVKA